MCKKWRSCVVSVLCLFCISCTLFLNTLHVDASRRINDLVVGSNLLESNGSTVTFWNQDTMILYSSETGYLTGENNDQFILSFNLPSDVEIDTNQIYGLAIHNFAVTTPYMPSNCSLSSSTIYYSYKGNIVAGYRSSANESLLNRYIYISGSDLLTYDNGNCRVPLTYKIINNFTVPVSTTSTRQGQATVRYTYKVYLYKMDESKIGASQYVSDPITQEQLEILNETQESIKDTTETIQEQSESFFNSFFGNFWDSLMGLFVPDDDYFSDWFDSLNQLLEDKLGILYWPFGKIISFYTRLSNALSNESRCVITFPAIQFTNAYTGETYTFLEAQQVDLESFNYRLPLSGGSANSNLVGTSRFNSLVSIVRTFNSAVLIFGFLSLLRNKLTIILRGESDDN